MSERKYTLKIGVAKRLDQDLQGFLAEITATVQAATRRVCDNAEIEVAVDVRELLAGHETIALLGVLMTCLPFGRT